MSVRLSSIVPSLVLAAVSSAYAQHVDINLSLQNNRITSNQAVFGYDFGEIALDPYNLGDPGFNAPTGSGFASGSTLNLSAAAMGGAFVRYWDGTGDVALSPAASGISLSIARSAALGVSLTGSGATYTPAAGNAVPIGTFNNGFMHQHIESSLFNNGSQTAGSIAEGVYVISFTLSNPGRLDSAPLYIVYNNGLAEEEHDAAIDFVNATFVPEPGALAVLAGGAMMAMRRRVGRDSSRRSNA